MKSTSEKVGLFALVHAAKLERIEAEHVLREEGVHPEEWKRWRKEVLVAIVTDAAAHHDYERAQGEAERRFHRPVKPLFDSHDAWTAFRRVVLSSDQGSAAEPGAHEADGAALDAALARHGLTLGDFARLNRHWKQRRAMNAQLAPSGTNMGVRPIEIGERTYLPEAAIRAKTEIASFETIDRLAAFAAASEASGDPERAASAHGFRSANDAAHAVARWLEGAPSREQLSLHRQRVEHHRKLVAANREHAAPARLKEPPPPKPPPLQASSTEAAGRAGATRDQELVAENLTAARTWLDLATFAGYLAEVDYFGGGEAEVRERFGIATAAIEKRIRASWSRRQEGNPALSKALTEAVYRHRWVLYERGIDPSSHGRGRAP